MIRTYVQPAVSVIIAVGLLALFMLPLAVGAQGESPSDLGGLVDVIISIINGILVPLILAIAFIVFVWGIFKYFIANTDDAKEKGRDLMVYGLIGFFVIISVWGIVNLLTNTISLEGNPDFQLPEASSPTF